MILALVITSCTANGIEIPVGPTSGTESTSGKKNNATETGGKKAEPKLTEEQALDLAKKATPRMLIEKLSGSSYEWWSDKKEVKEYIDYKSSSEPIMDGNQVLKQGETKVDVNLLKPYVFGDIGNYKNVTMDSLTYKMHCEKIMKDGKAKVKEYRKYNYVIKCNYEGKTYETTYELNIDIVDLIEVSPTSVNLKINGSKEINVYNDRNKFTVFANV